jgi:hypothetical protein
MAAVTDHASAAAAVSAGWAKTQIDRGAANAGPDRFITRFEKPLSGGGAGGEAGSVQIIEGASPTSAAAADTAALSNLNGFRRHYYGGAPGRASGDSDSPHSRGGTHTVDVT